MQDPKSCDLPLVDAPTPPGTESSGPGGAYFEQRWTILSVRLKSRRAGNTPAHPPTLEGASGEEAEKRKHVLEDLLKYTKVHPKSEGIIHYNIARIAKAQRNEEEANKHLEEAKKTIPELVKTRIALDPIWKEV